MLKEVKTKRQHYFIDENNYKQGEYKAYHFNGTLWEHAFYLNNKLHGEYKYYRDNGQLWIHSFYQNDNLHGENKKYHDNGKLAYSTFFYHGNDLIVNPDALTKKDKTYILLAGRLPSRD
jgi:antitoxin component YwqK of YwqJK toxin-antitoxin module